MWGRLGSLRRRCYTAVFLTLCISCFMYLYFSLYFKHERHIVIHHLEGVPTPEANERKHKYFGEPDKWEAERTCKIPRVYPFEESALHLIETQLHRKKVKPPPCLKNPPRFKTDLNSTLTRVNETDPFWKTVNCCYTPFITEEKYKLKYLNPEPESCIPITENSFVVDEEHENVRIFCNSTKKASKMLYRDYFNFFRFNATKEAKSQEAEELARASGNDFLSVIVLGLDSVAMSNFQRFLPKTRNYLVNDMAAIEFIGLNKVGRGTMENLVPALSGCPFIDGKVVFPNKTEECHLIWGKYAKKGYRTVLSEEQFWFYAYNYMKRNKKGPLEMDYSNLAFIKGVQSTCAYALGTFGCFEHQFAPSHLKERILEVATKMEGKLYYHHLWSALTSHDVIGMAKHLDGPYFELMQRLHEGQLLENTLLILYSDHGTVSSDYSRTSEGLIEARVPLLYFVLPQWFKDKYTSAVENLQRNAQSLTSPFDLHQTLVDILDLSTITNEALPSRSLEVKHQEFGLSLFLPIQLDRSCQSAHIPDEYCICWSWTQMDNPHNDINVIRAVSFTMDKVNRELDKYSKCHRLDLEKVIAGKMTVDGDGNTLYEIIYQTIPSHGIFGAVLRVESVTEDDITFKIIGEVERQNTYGNQSSCLGKAQKDMGWIRSVCFCK